MKKIVSLGFSLLVAAGGFAQDKIEQDKDAIKAMAGCYKVTFNFAETFSPDKDYVKDDNYSSWAYEYVKVIEEEDNHIALQHLLIVNEDKDPMIIKHWRQDWDYENTDFYMFNKYNPDTHGQEWNFISKPKTEVEGQWTQKVFQVDDSPRYEGSATWVHVDGRHYWENKTDAPLPRREYTKRHDYNVTQRTNKHELTDYGWLHEQDNAKVLRMESGDKIIAFEKGWNTYEKVDANICEPAVEWWEENKSIWKNVRTAWTNKFNEKKALTLWPKKGKTLMYSKFFILEENDSVEEIENIIEEFSKN